MNLVERKIIDYLKYLYYLNERQQEEIAEKIIKLSKEKKESFLLLLYKRYKNSIKNKNKLLNDIKIVENSIFEMKEKSDSDKILEQLNNL